MAAPSDQSTGAVTSMSAERLKSSSSAGRPDLWNATLPVAITRPRSSSARSATARAVRTAARRTASSRYVSLEPMAETWSNSEIGILTPSGSIRTTTSSTSPMLAMSSSES